MQHARALTPSFRGGCCVGWVEVHSGIRWWDVGRTDASRPTTDGGRAWHTAMADAGIQKIKVANPVVDLDGCAAARHARDYRASSSRRAQAMR